MTYTFPNPAQQEQNRGRSSTRRRGDAEIGAEKTRTRSAGRAGFAAFLRRAEPAESAEEKPCGVRRACPRWKSLFPGMTYTFLSSLISLSSIMGAGPEMPPRLRTRQKCTIDLKSVV